MIAVDTSALYAIFLKEKEAPDFFDLMQHNDLCISAATRFEAHVVALRSYPFITPKAIDAFLSEMNMAVLAADTKQMDIAIEAYQNFGKGRHPAGLNLGDCFSYALAKEQNLPLLYKGEDFSKTDVQSAA